MSEDMSDVFSSVKHYTAEITAYTKTGKQTAAALSWAQEKVCKDRLFKGKLLSEMVKAFPNGFCLQVKKTDLPSNATFV